MRQLDKATIRAAVVHVRDALRQNHSALDQNFSSGSGSDILKDLHDAMVKCFWHSVGVLAVTIVIYVPVSIVVVIVGLIFEMSLAAIPLLLGIVAGIFFIPALLNIIVTSRRPIGWLYHGERPERDSYQSSAYKRFIEKWVSPLAHQDTLEYRVYYTLNYIEEKSLEYRLALGPDLIKEAETIMQILDGQTGVPGESITQNILIIIMLLSLSSEDINKKMPMLVKGISDGGEYSRLLKIFASVWSGVKVATGQNDEIIQGMIEVFLLDVIAEDTRIWLLMCLIQHNLELFNSMLAYNNAEFNACYLKAHRDNSAVQQAVLNVGNTTLAHRLVHKGERVVSQPEKSIMAGSDDKYWYSLLQEDLLLIDYVPEGRKLELLNQLIRNNTDDSLVIWNVVQHVVLLLPEDKLRKGWVTAENIIYILNSRHDHVKDIVLYHGLSSHAGVMQEVLHNDALSQDGRDKIIGYVLSKWCDDTVRDAVMSVDNITHFLSGEGVSPEYKAMIKNYICELKCDSPVKVRLMNVPTIKTWLKREEPLVHRFAAVQYVLKSKVLSVQYKRELITRHLCMELLRDWSFSREGAPNLDAYIPLLLNDRLVQDVFSRGFALQDYWDDYFKSQDGAYEPDKALVRLIEQICAKYEAPFSETAESQAIIKSNEKALTIIKTGRQNRTCVYSDILSQLANDPDVTHYGRYDLKEKEEHDIEQLLGIVKPEASSNLTAELVDLYLSVLRVYAEQSEAILPQAFLNAQEDKHLLHIDLESLGEDGCAFVRNMEYVIYAVMGSNAVWIGRFISELASNEKAQTIARLLKELDSTGRFGNSPSLFDEKMQQCLEHIFCFRQSDPGAYKAAFAQEEAVMIEAKKRAEQSNLGQQATDVTLPSRRSIPIGSLPGFWAKEAVVCDGVRQLTVCRLASGLRIILP